VSHDETRNGHLLLEKPFELPASSEAVHDALYKDRINLSLPSRVLYSLEILRLFSLAHLEASVSQKKGGCIRNEALTILYLPFLFRHEVLFALCPTRRFDAAGVR
jgi:hypothetical protein